jgi:hypothetical protein
MCTLHVICVAYQRANQLSILMNSFLVQSDNRWMLHVIHDGPAPQDVKDVINLPQYRDSRIEYMETPTVNGHYGHPNRQIALKKIPLNHRDYVLMTNDDNYYIPKFVEYFLKECRRDDVGFVYCDTLHSYYDYTVLSTEVQENHIDMGSFMVKLDVARRVGFTHIHLSADGTYAVECANYCRVRRFRLVHIAKPIFIHN